MAVRRSPVVERVTGMDGDGADGGPTRASEPSPADEATREERTLRRWLLALTVLFAAQAALYLPEFWSGPPETRPFAVNSFAKDAVFAALIGIAAADVRRFGRLIAFVIVGHIAIALLLAIGLISGRYEAVFPPPGESAGAWPFAAWLAGALVMIGVLVWLYRRAMRARYTLRYLWPIEHDTLAAVADAILDAPKVPPREIAAAVDAYWDSLRIREKRRLRFALWIVCFVPLVWLKAPLPLQARERRRGFLEHRLLPDIATRANLRWFRTLVQSSVRFVMQLVYVGYYSNERTYPDTRYVPFSKRPGRHEDPRPERQLRTLAPDDAAGKHLEADVVVVGSGAGGAIAAHALAAHGHEVLIVERGPHVPRSKFTENERDMYARLYSDGALQLSRDFSVQVLQGMCVGGSTVVNNGVSFNIPPDVLEEWNERYDAGLDPPTLQQSFDAVREVVSVQCQHEPPPNPVADRIGRAADCRDTSQKPGRLRPVEANLDGCLGCGQCNIGCRYGKKLSMLETVLPDIQEKYGDRLRILPDCAAEGILVHERRATGVRGRLQLRGRRSSTVEVHARRAVVVAAGAVHSSLLLMRSGIGGERVGHGLCANLGSHLTAYFQDGPPLNAFDGLQMSHYVDEGGPGGPVIETWFNPVMSQALVTPGWLGDHQANMNRYNRLSCLGVLVGSDVQPGNRVRKRPALNGAQYDFTPSEADLDRLLGGLKRAGEILLASGANCVMPATFRYWELGAGDLAKLRRGDGGIVTDASDISVSTAHPQGGNPMSRHSARGVVDERFRVHGYENLHVCDASVFPSAVTVNPQLTVMALAHLAGSHYIAD
ncbi:MAG: GMC family oxidoreductase N-terminal domain-containing protein [Thermoleophilaceae bacterium]|nr:GMC family oxidoreductase N-terminal domain-containing protein [Thermoleophilaceae bacterium]